MLALISGSSSSGVYQFCRESRSASDKSMSEIFRKDAKCDRKTKKKKYEQQTHLDEIKFCWKISTLLNMKDIFGSINIIKATKITLCHKNKIKKQNFFEKG